MQRVVPQRGFSLLEMIIVLIILSVLSIIVIPIFLNEKEEIKELTHNTNIRLLKVNAKRYLVSENVSLPQTDIIQGMYDKGYISEIPENPLKTGDYIVAVDINGNITVTLEIQ
ncbi:MAG TPA: hypothetical protein DEP72_07060 [Clostridiales bacterium]|nr:MAG: hypothetical protein A2Y18_00625 [Clostridiales bacterium GWD2_32_19]HCC07898.1 hypothetical protein [Clostridiales bacterium]